MSEGGSEIKFDSVFLAGSWRARANNFSKVTKTFEPDPPQHFEITRCFNGRSRGEG